MKLPMHNAQAIVFDLDGTLVDTEDMWALATKQMLIARGICYTDKLKKRIHTAVHGLPPLQACTLLKELVALKETPEQLATEKKERAFTLMKGNIHYIPGAYAFIKAVIAANINIAIATNCSTEIVALIMDECPELSQFFQEHIYTPQHVGNRPKPHPAIYQHATRMLNVLPEKSIAIEDSAHGMQSAKNAGLFCIGLNRNGTEDQLPKADIVVQNYEQILLKKIMNR